MATVATKGKVSGKLIKEKYTVLKQLEEGLCQEEVSGCYKILHSKKYLVNLDQE